MKGGSMQYINYIIILSLLSDILILRLIRHRWISCLSSFCQPAYQSSICTSADGWAHSGHCLAGL